MTVSDVLKAIEHLAPRSLAYSFDKIGLQVGNPSQKVSKVVVSLDHSNGLIDFANQVGAQLVVTHHPLIFDPLHSLNETGGIESLIRRLITSDLSLIAAHTNWDVAPGGINDALAEALNLQDIEPFGSRPESKRLKVVTFAPEEAADAIVDASATAGAGRIGLYERCAFSSAGTGTFLGMDGSNPVVGRTGEIENASEIRIETELHASMRGAVDRAIRSAHPYEEPVIDFYPLEGGAAGQIGRRGVLPTPMALKDLVKFVETKLETWCTTWGDPDRVVSTVGVAGGAADGEWRHAQTDVFLTGEIKQHIALEGTESGLAMIAAGHYATEQPGVVALAARLAEALQGVQLEVFVPKPGTFGRPML
ncbi:MAG TPA: Nif3-like dinuclear metal center hexameric protein [Fimbriimonadaceae bacterium]|nr:Nif3-like dinuclear metal center hexameric protein [Fimbriimonadaceae bacterium]